MADSFATKGELEVAGRRYVIHRLAPLAKQYPAIERLPISLKILLENLLRHEDGRVVRKEDVEALCRWDPRAEPDAEISFHPARVLLQDFTGVPAVVDLAAMREAFLKLGGDPRRINPLAQADLVIDHSVQLDAYGSSQAIAENTRLEYERNRERYVFLRWGQQAFENLRVVPPETGICHQVNLEYLASAVFVKDGVAFPDTLVGTDSHTVMINGLGVVGWGVGGIEAEAALLGQPITMLIPQVIGYRLTGRPAPGVTATDVVLTVTQALRRKGVVGKFVEFFGPGLDALPLADRATIANMAPEYGATIGFFPIDEETLSYLRFSGRAEEQVQLVEQYCKENGLFRRKGAPDPIFTDVVELDLGAVEPSLAGPRRPQDRVPLKDVKASFRKALQELPAKSSLREVQIGGDAGTYGLGHGAVAIASITSCTNTSNPGVLIGAGLVARRAVERGIRVKPWVKTSLAPGSKVVTEYLRESGLLPYLEALGFHVAGYGCTTCIGNSGPLPQPVSDAVRRHDLTVAAVISGNRNFEGRVNPQVKLNYLASPGLVVAYALAGSVDVDLATEPLGIDPNGKPVFLKDVWPTDEELRVALARGVKQEQFKRVYAELFTGGEGWRTLAVPEGQTYSWQADSTYVRLPPFFDGLTKEPRALTPIAGARVLAVLGDSVTTDHISPAGDIASDGPAAKYLEANGVRKADFNSFGARRGNHEVMMRGTFANIRLKNLLVPGVEGGVTVHLPTNERMSIFDAAMKYQAEETQLVILAGAEYGTGSSRDWAAKGTMLLGVRAVITKSFERIHRSNLIGMGVLPLQFEPGQDVASLGLTGKEVLTIEGVEHGVKPAQKLTVKATGDGGKVTTFTALARIDTPNEADYFRHGGILQYVMRSMLAK